MALAVCLLLVGCEAISGNTPGPTRTIPPETGLRGIVRLGPTCPVESGAEPCVTPYAAVLVILDQTNREAARVTSGPDGRFEVALPPGEYTITPTPGDPFPTAVAQAVSVAEGSFTEVEVVYDTGLR